MHIKVGKQHGKIERLDVLLVSKVCKATWKSASEEQTNIGLLFVPVSSWWCFGICGLWI
jgi:hypothetical protein